jgi:putative nucleotidyltransferase with HDIG domain
MNPLFALCPQPPNWSVAWDEIDAAFPWIRDLRGCTQDAIHHGEGDVWTHTRMVCEAMASLPAWRQQEDETRRLLFAAALLHDIAKPASRREDVPGHITFPGHARRGAIMARAILWRLGVPFAIRESTCALVRHHLKPFFLADHPDCRRVALELSQTARCDWLAILAESDARGRICQDLQRLLDNIALFADYAREQDCFNHAWLFPSDHARFVYFHDNGRSPDVMPHEDFRCEVVLLSGLPGAGKDHHRNTQFSDWPCVSLDQLRDELDIDPEDEQGAVLQAARAQARQYLRDRRSFVWNATNLSRLVRGEAIRLLAGYQGRIRIVYVEVSEETLKRQNRKRPRPVPEKVLEHLLSRWEVPDLTEAHEVEWHVRE